ncbi:hypothetical protein [Streptomyces sp. NPDC001970]
MTPASTSAARRGMNRSVAMGADQVAEQMLPALENNANEALIDAFTRDTRTALSGYVEACCTASRPEPAGE